MPTTTKQKVKSTWCALCKKHEHIPDGWRFPKTYLNGKWHNWPKLDDTERPTFLANSHSPIDSNNIRTFMLGRCDTFALALHEMTGWTIVFGLVCDPGGNEGGDNTYQNLRILIDHAWCQRSDGSVVDIRGIHPNASNMLDTTYHRAYAVAHPKIDADYLWEATNQDYILAKSLISKYSTFFGIDTETKVCQQECCNEISRVSRSITKQIV